MKRNIQYNNLIEKRKNMETLLERFIRYCKINTRSDELSSTIPSTLAQVEFAELLVNDLKDMSALQLKVI